MRITPRIESGSGWARWMATLTANSVTRTERCRRVVSLIAHRQAPAAERQCRGLGCTGPAGTGGMLGEVGSPKSEWDV